MRPIQTRLPDLDIGYKDLWWTLTSTKYKKESHNE
jgi:hypothetical protein